MTGGVKRYTFINFLYGNFVSRNSQPCSPLAVPFLQLRFEIRLLSTLLYPLHYRTPLDTSDCICHILGRSLPIRSRNCYSFYIFLSSSGSLSFLLSSIKYPFLSYRFGFNRFPCKSLIVIHSGPTLLEIASLICFSSTK